MLHTGRRTSFTFICQFKISSHSVKHDVSPRMLSATPQWQIILDPGYLPVICQHRHTAQTHFVTSTFFVSRNRCTPIFHLSSFYYHLSLLFTQLQQHSAACPSLLLWLSVKSTMDQRHWQPLQPEKKKWGRPKGSKDKPRQPGDKPRGRPRKVNPADSVQVVDIDGKSHFRLQFLLKYFSHFLLLLRLRSIGGWWVF